MIVQRVGPPLAVAPHGEERFLGSTRRLQAERSERIQSRWRGLFGHRLIFAAVAVRRLRRRRISQTPRLRCATASSNASEAAELSCGAALLVLDQTDLYAHPMYLSSLNLYGVKRLRDLRLDFRRNGKPRMWTVLLGENGTCKTTVLQAIAMAATGYVRANQLADVPSLLDVREEIGAKIDAVFEFGTTGHAQREYPDLSSRSDSPPLVGSQLTLAPGEALLRGESWYLHQPSARQTDPITTARSRNLPGWFVAGFGTTRVLPRPQTSDRLEDPVLSRLNPLFDKGRLVGTGFADILEDPLAFARLLRQALIEKGLLPDAVNIELRGKGGVSSAAKLVESHRFDFKVGRSEVRVPATWLSQGYQSTIAWVADIIGHMLAEAGNRELSLSEMEGLVLIDEIDLHLHPRWQRGVVLALKEIFPRVQFIATTHSPMILSGLTQDEVVILANDADGNIVQEPSPENPALLTGSELFREFFGVQSLHTLLGAQLQEYGYLVGDPHRSDAQENRMHELQHELAAAGADPGWKAVPREDTPPRKEMKAETM